MKSLRPAWSLLGGALCLLALAGCGGEEPPAPTVDSPDVASDAPEMNPDVAPAEPPQPKSPFEGAWDMSEINGQPLDVVIYGDGTAVSNWTAVSDDRQSYEGFGEFGEWSEQDGRVVISYDSGWRDVIQRDGETYNKLTYSPGITTNDEPSSIGSARRIDGAIVPFLGIWKVSSTPVALLAIKSDGTASKFHDPAATGQWKPTPANGGAEILWSDGKVNLLRKTDDGYVLEVYKKDVKPYGSVVEEVIEKVEPTPAPAPTESPAPVEGDAPLEGTTPPTEGGPANPDTEATPAVGPPKPQGPKPEATYPVESLHRVPAS